MCINLATSFEKKIDAFVVSYSSLNRAVAEYLSRDLSYQISPDDVHITAGCLQAIEILISALATPGANILLPRPTYPMYDSRASFSQLEVRYFDLLPENGWDVDLVAVEALADDKTVAIVLINPCNPCGNVFSRQHLQKVSTCFLLFVLPLLNDRFGLLVEMGFVKTHFFHQSWLFFGFTAELFSFFVNMPLSTLYGG